MLARRLISIYVILFFLLSGCRNVDSEQKEASKKFMPLLEHASNMYRYGQKLTAISLVDSVFQSLKNQASDSSKFLFYQFMYDAYYGIGEQEKVGLYADSMLLLFETGIIDRQKYKKQYTVANFSKADWLYEIGRYQDAYKYYYTAKQQAAADGDSCLMGYYNHKLGIVFYTSAKYRHSITSFIEAKRLLNTCNDFGSFYRMQEIDDNIGLCYSNLKVYDSALIYYAKSIAMLKDGYVKYADRQKLLLDKAVGVVYGNMGSAYVGLNNLDSAEKLFKESIAINRKPEHDNTDALYTRIKLANIYLQKNLLHDAALELDTSKHLLEVIKDKEAILRWYNTMWKYDRATGNNASAVNYLVRYVSLKDSLDAQNLSLQKIELDSRVRNMEHNAEIAALKKTDESRTKLLILASAVAILTAVVSFLLYKNWSVSKDNYESLKHLNTYTNNQKEQLRGLLKELGKATNEKDRILKAVSHDMRSPVNASLALIDLIEADKESLTEDQQHYLQLLRDSSNSALSLTKDLLEVATLNSDSLNKQSTDLNALAAAIVGLLRFKAAEKQQHIELEASLESAECSVDKEKITRVVNNLINNAIKFSPSGATINIAIGKKDSQVELSVKDNGIGIPENMKDKVFDVFTEAKRFGTSGEQPYGLGLSISKQIVEAHGGKIWLESEEGAGTTFHISLPA